MTFLCVNMSEMKFVGKFYDKFVICTDYHNFWDDNDDLVRDNF